MHEGLSQFGTAVSHKGQRLGEIVLAPGGLEIGEGLVLGFGVTSAPVHEEAGDEAAEQAQDPQAVSVAGTALAMFCSRVGWLFCTVRR